MGGLKRPWQGAGLPTPTRTSQQRPQAVRTTARGQLAALCDLVPPSTRVSDKPRGPMSSALQPSEGRGCCPGCVRPALRTLEAATAVAQRLAAERGSLHLWHPGTLNGL